MRFRFAWAPRTSHVLKARLPSGTPLYHRRRLSGFEGMLGCFKGLRIPDSGSGIRKGMGSILGVMGSSYRNLLLLTPKPPVTPVTALSELLCGSNKPFP